MFFLSLRFKNLLRLSSCSGFFHSTVRGRGGRCPHTRLNAARTFLRKGGNRASAPPNHNQRFPVSLYLPVSASVEFFAVFQQMKRDDGKFTHDGYDDHFWRLALGFKPCGKVGKCAHAVGYKGRHIQRRSCFGLSNL